LRQFIKKKKLAGIGKACFAPKISKSVLAPNKKVIIYKSKKEKVKLYYCVLILLRFFFRVLLFVSLITPALNAAP